MKKYNVIIKTPNRMFSVKGILVRTPAKWIADEDEIKNIRLKITSEGIENFSIEEIDPDKKEEAVVDEKIEEVTEDIIEDQVEPTSTLEKLMAEK